MSPEPQRNINIQPTPDTSAEETDKVLDEHRKEYSDQVADLQKNLDSLKDVYKNDQRPEVTQWLQQADAYITTNLKSVQDTVRTMGININQYNEAFRAAERKIQDCRDVLKGPLAEKNPELQRSYGDVLSGRRKTEAAASGKIVSTSEWNTQYAWNGYGQAEKQENYTVINVDVPEGCTISSNQPLIEAVKMHSGITRFRFDRTVQGAQVPDFKLTDTDGKTHDLKTYGFYKQPGVYQGQFELELPDALKEKWSPKPAPEKPAAEKPTVSEKPVLPESECRTAEDAIRNQVGGLKPFNETELRQAVDTVNKYYAQSGVKPPVAMWSEMQVTGHKEIVVSFKEGKYEVHNAKQEAFDKRMDTTRNYITQESDKLFADFRKAWKKPTKEALDAYLGNIQKFRTDLRKKLQDRAAEPGVELDDKLVALLDQQIKILENNWLVDPQLDELKAKVASPEGKHEVNKLELQERFESIYPGVTVLDGGKPGEFQIWVNPNDASTIEKVGGKLVDSAKRNGLVPPDTEFNADSRTINITVTGMEGTRFVGPYPRTAPPTMKEAAKAKPAEAAKAKPVEAAKAKPAEAAKAKPAEAAKAKPVEAAKAKPAEAAKAKPAEAAKAKPVEAAKAKPAEAAKAKPAEAAKAKPVEAAKAKPAEAAKAKPAEAAKAAEKPATKPDVKAKSTEKAPPNPAKYPDKSPAKAETAKTAPAKAESKENAELVEIRALIAEMKKLLEQLEKIQKGPAAPASKEPEPAKGADKGANKEPSKTDKPKDKEPAGPESPDIAAKKAEIAGYKAEQVAARAELGTFAKGGSDSLEKNADRIQELAKSIKNLEAKITTATAQLRVLEAKAAVPTSPDVNKQRQELLKNIGVDAKVEGNTITLTADAALNAKLNKALKTLGKKLDVIGLKNTSGKEGPVKFEANEFFWKTPQTKDFLKAVISLCKIVKDQKALDGYVKQIAA